MVVEARAKNRRIKCLNFNPLRLISFQIFRVNCKKKHDKQSRMVFELGIRFEVQLE